MKTSKFIAAIAAAAALFAAASPAIAADKDDGKELHILYMSPVNASAQAAMVAKIKANLVAAKGPCLAIANDIKSSPEEYVPNQNSTIRCEKAPYGALLFGSTIQNVDGKPARSGFVYYVSADKSVDVLAANAR